MSSRTVAVAAPSEAAAQAGRVVSEAGGNAVDAALAASLVTMVNEPGIVSLASGCFVTVQPADGGAAVTVDGWAEMPGRGLEPTRFGQAMWQITTEYGGGVTMTIGPGSVATPGTVAAIVNAHEQWGAAPWQEIVAPAIAVARDGFLIGTAARYYLGYLHDDLYGWDEASRAVLHDDAGEFVPSGHTLRVPGLTDTLELLANEGSDPFYRGDIAAAMADAVEERGGILTRDDLAAYRPVTRTSLVAAAGDWILATNPPPSVGGASVAAMLRLLDGRPRGAWTLDDTARLVDVQRRVLRHRIEHLEGAEDLDAEVRRLMAMTEQSDARQLWSSSSTTHVSATDTDGTACAITVSSGYGSGMLAGETGVWLNNCLGEPELNSGGLHGLAPGTRLISNMAPSVARRPDGAVLALGSPGADRISTAIVQAMAGIAGGMSLRDAIDHPRAHVRIDRSDRALPVVLDYEEGLPLPELDLPTLELPANSMYFGGVAAAAYEPAVGLVAAADPRRSGAVAISR